MNNLSPLISVGLPVYNGAAYIRETIDSVLAQSFENFELIVTDNVSTDETAQIVQEYARKDSRVRYFRNETNVGAARNYNLCFRHARGQYFKWTAHDDLINPEFLEECLRGFEEKPDAVMAYGRRIPINSDGQVIDDGADGGISPVSKNPEERFNFHITEMKATGALNFGLFKCSALAKSTLHRPYYSSDRAFLAEMSAIGNFVYVENAITYCREHENRSYHIKDRVVRSKWIGGSKSRLAAAEHLNLTKHLFEIAGRHKDLVSPWKMRWKVIKFVMRPRQIAGYTLDLISMLFPKAAYSIKASLARAK